MRIEMATAPGSPQRPNEDHVFATAPAAGSGGVLVLLDGVTPPGGEYGCRHSVPWFTAHLGGALAELTGARVDMTLADCLAEAIERTAARHSGTCDLSHPRTPQATVVLARWDEERTEHLVLSDSVLLVETAGGEVEAVLDDRLGRLPEPVPSLRARTTALPPGSPAREELRREQAAAVEQLRNAPDGTGFYTAAADPSVAAYAVTGGHPRPQVRTLAAFSDGASRWSETFRLGGWSELLELARKEGPRAVISRVREAEDADPDGVRHRRGKRHDDASVVVAELEQVGSVGRGAGVQRPR
ncbi:protein phosphatase 2C domain-containing protein [Streptomyces sulphureus]|uniref:protein phosphatase 2C domain-containing protein n=1 Tax=Streptomyces sulphureus TaxID=47758 RepID=UPI0003652BEC|nr:protein phosphatase 2C domain-containing protein [Streptomyces sulphureus]